MKAEVTTQHHWLERLHGEWDVAADAITAPPTESTWVERVRPLGDLWAVCEGSGLMPDGAEGQTLMTLGYDPERQRYVGTWIGSMMTYLWHYEGALEPTGDLLALHCMGPDFDNPGQKLPYQDVITFIDDHHRTLTALVHKPDGHWHKLMEMHYWKRR